MNSLACMPITALLTNGVSFVAVSTAPVISVLAWDTQWSFIRYANLFMHTQYCFVKQTSRKLYILGGRSRDLFR